MQDAASDLTAPSKATPRVDHKAPPRLPAADIPIPTGTPIFAAAAGVIVSTPRSSNYRIGVVINGDDGAQYT